MTAVAAPHPYATSHALWNIETESADGQVLAAVAKETSHRPEARPRFVHRPLREREVYRLLLDGSGAPTPRLLGVAGSFIILERLAAAPLWQTAVGEVASRAGKALRKTHDALAGHTAAPFLLRYDASFYRRWLRRARLLDPSTAWLGDVYAAACARLLREPLVVIHGELYPSNVLVGEQDVWFVDWESAAAGPAVIDVAALVSGWSEPAVDALLRSYGAVDTVVLDCARLHLAVRWLGWSAGWRPPREHARDWRAEAEQTATRLESSLE